MLKIALKIGWLAAFLLILGMYENVILSTTESPFHKGWEAEPIVVLLGLMVVLSFPIGLLAFLALDLIVTAIEATLGIVHPSWDLHGYLSADMTAQIVAFHIQWASIMVAGYYQWFVLVPWIVRRYRGRPPDSDSDLTSNDVTA